MSQNQTTPNQSTPKKSGPDYGLGLLCLAGAVGVFIVCSIIQGIGHSNMFSMSYPEPDNVLVGLLLNVTFYPGWLLIGSLVMYGVASFFSHD